MKRKITALILLSIMLLGVLAGCKDNTNSTKATTTATQVVTKEVTSTETPSTVTPAQPDVDYSEIYDDLLFKIYQHILAITYDPELSDEMIGDIGIRETVAFFSESDALKAVGYAESDINKDDIPELLIYLIDDNGNEKCAGTRILAAYTVSNNTPALIFEGTSRNRFYLLSDGLIYNENSNGAASTIFGTYTLKNGAKELTAENYYFTSVSGEGNSIEFYHNTTGEFDTDKSEKFTGNEDDFWAIQTELAAKISESELKPFEVFSAGPDDMPSYVTAYFADETLVELTNAERFTADNSEYAQDIVFFANFGDIYNFEFCSINWLDESDGGESDIEFVPMYTTDTLTTDTPLVVTMTFWGDIPSYGITYTDSEGIDHTGLLSLSGEDGSVVLDIY